MAGGFITVRNGGGYVAKFKVRYTLAGKKVTKETNNFTLGKNKTLPIPDGASNIFLEVEEYVFFGSTSTIFTEQFDEPPQNYYKIWGTTLSPAWCQTDSHFDCLKTCPAALENQHGPAAMAVAMVPDRDEHAHAEAAPAGPEGAELTVLGASDFAAAGGHGLNGCIGLFAGLSLCYDVSIAPPSAHVCLEFAGIELACLDLSAAKPCATLKGDYKLVSWDLELCLDLTGKKITLKGKVCTLGMCKKFDLTVLSW
ncbi:MAG: hypothetical protein ACE37K_25985 [Planctomycetota bacterium]